MTKILFLSKKKAATHGTYLMRCLQPADLLRKRNYDVVVGPIYRTVPQHTDVLILHRVAMDFATKAVIALARSQGALILYDVDDLLFESNGHLANADLYRESMLACDAVLVSSEFLAQKAKQFHPHVHVMRNHVRDDLFEMGRMLSRPPTVADRFVTFAYLSGSRYHDDDLALIVPSLVRLLERNPRVRLLLMGKLNVPEELLRFKDQLDVREFLPYEAFLKTFAEIDVNLVPLRIGDAFSQARSELKYIEAAAFGVPTIASATQTFAAIIDNGANGFLIDAASWTDLLEDLSRDDERRRRVGNEARSLVERRYAGTVLADEWCELIESSQTSFADCIKARRSRVRAVWFLLLAWINYFLRARKWVRRALP